MPFTKIAHMKNPLSNNDPIKKARDTQEITTDLGIQIALLIDEHRIPDAIDLPYIMSRDPAITIESLKKPSEFAIKNYKYVKEKIN